MYGILACTGSSTGTDAVSVVSGYSSMALGTANTSALCLTTTNWIWGATNSAQTHLFNTSSIVTDAAELWTLGGRIDVNANGPAGVDPVHVAVGGVNGKPSFGLGVWNMMIWVTDKNGVSETAALYSASAGTAYAEMNEPGAGVMNVMQLNIAKNAATFLYSLRSSEANQSACLTTVTQYEELQTTAYNGGTSDAGDSDFVTGGYAGSSMGCLDYVTDEMNISGIYVMYALTTQTILIENNNQAAVIAAGEAVSDGVKPVTSVLGHATGTNIFKHNPNTTAPADNPTGNLIFSMNFGVLK